MRIALIRHGLTVGNLYKAYVGRSDQPLCAEGKADLESKRENAGYPQMDVIYASSMTRCVQTAKICYPNKPIVEFPELRERDFGRFEGMNHKEITAQPGHEHWGKTPESMVFPGGEDWDAFAARSQTGFLRAVERTKNGGRGSMAVICHGGTIMAIMERFVDPGKSRYEWACAPGRGFVILFDNRSKSGKLSRRICP